MRRSRISPAASVPVAIALSAYLFFTVQLVSARILLPWFGGAPEVFAVTLVFFQAVLFVGYAWSHALSSRLRPWTQRGVQMVLLALSAGFLAYTAAARGSPFLPPDSLRPTEGGNSALRILGLLASTTGLPAFTLATTTPLLQAWYVRLHAGRPPWRLYALSNLASMLALVAYPVAVEPHIGLKTQGLAWAVLFGAFALASAQAAGLQGHASPAPPRPAAALGVRATRAAAWILIAACGSALLVSTTNRIGIDVAVIPLFWVLPLALYLLSFVLAFAIGRASGSAMPAALFVPALAMSLLALWRGRLASIAFELAAYLFALFLGCLVCHGALYRLRPAPAGLTAFYLAIAGGGALGGSFAALAAPVLFAGTWEFHMALLATTTVCAFAISAPPGRRRGWRIAAAAALVAATGVALALRIRDLGVGVLEARRGFFGVVRVVDASPHDPVRHSWVLRDGMTDHGFQFHADTRRRLPVAYYAPATGLGLSLTHHPRRRRGDQMDIGVVGLGAGTIAAYGRPGDTITFYELNPDVTSLAAGPLPRFTFVEDSAARVSIVPGDARVSVEREARAGIAHRFDVFVLDGFSDASIPVHLLTDEAFDAWLPQLRDRESILAANVSSRHAELRPLLERVAAERGLAAVDVDRPGNGQEEWASDWVLLARDPAVLEDPAIRAESRPLTEWGGFGPFTDDTSNLLRLLRND